MARSGCCARVERLTSKLILDLTWEMSGTSTKKPAYILTLCLDDRRLGERGTLRGRRVARVGDLRRAVVSPGV